MSTKNKNNANDYMRKALIEAQRVKKIAEEAVKAEILESLAPNIRQAVASSISEMDDFEEEEMDEMDDYELKEEESEEDVELEDAPEDEEEVVMEAEDEEDEVEVEADPEVGEDDVEAEIPAEEEVSAEEDEDLDEAGAMDDDVEAFIKELKSVIGETEDEEDYSEESEEELPMEEGSSYDELEEGEKSDEDKEDLDEGDLGKGGENAELKKTKAELAETKRTLAKITKMMNESNLDVERNKAYQSIVKKFNLTETSKLKMMKKFDSAEDVKQISSIKESIVKVLDKKATKLEEANSKSKRRSKAGVTSRGVKTSMKENRGSAKKAVISESLASRLSELI